MGLWASRPRPRATALAVFGHELSTSPPNLRDVVPTSRSVMPAWSQYLSRRVLFHWHPAQRPSLSVRPSPIQARVLVTPRPIRQASHAVLLQDQVEGKAKTGADEVRERAWVGQSGGEVVFPSNSGKTKQWSRSSAGKRARDDNDAADKRRKIGDGDGLPSQQGPNEERKPKRKVAVLIGYSGTGYKGMQLYVSTLRAMSSR